MSVLYCILYRITLQSSSHGLSSILYRLPVNCQCRLIEWFCVYILYLNYPRVVMSVLYCILYRITLQSSSHGLSSILYRLPVDCQSRLIEWFCVHILYLNYPRVGMGVLYSTLYPFNLPLMVSQVSCTGCQWIVSADLMNGSAYTFYTLIILG